MTASAESKQIFRLLHFQGMHIDKKTFGIGIMHLSFD